MSPAPHPDLFRTTLQRNKLAEPQRTAALNLLKLLLTEAMLAAQENKRKDNHQEEKKND